MDWRFFDWLYWVYGIFSSVREYFSGIYTQNAWDGSGFVEAVEDDGGVGDQRDTCGTAMNSENGNAADTVSDGAGSVFNIHLASNTGTVVIGDKTTVTYVENVGAASCEKEKNEKTTSLALSKLNERKEEPLMVNVNKMNNKGKRRPKRKSSEMDTKSSKVSSVAKRINAIDKELSKCRGNGDWIAHNNAIERLFNEYRRDEHNSDIIPLLNYEKAAALCERNEIDSSIKLITELGREIKVTERSKWELANDIEKFIFCKCLFLASKLYCIKRTFGKAQKSLDVASNLLSDYNNVELKAQLCLANAYYQLCFNQSHCTSERANLVIKDTDKAEQICTKLKGQVEEKWEKLRRKILLIRCKAVIQLYLDSGDKEEFASVLSNSLGELEDQLWNGISLRQKVDFNILKSNYFKIHGNAAKALDHAQVALQIAQECQFNKEVLLMNDHIRKLKVFPEDPVNDSERLVKKVLAIQTTTDGNVESNAAEMTDRGIFSTDESEWESSDRLLEQDHGYLLEQQIEDNEEDSDTL